MNMDSEYDTDYTKTIVIDHFSATEGMFPSHRCSAENRKSLGQPHHGNAITLAVDGPKAKVPRRYDSIESETR